MRRIATKKLLAVIFTVLAVSVCFPQQPDSPGTEYNQVLLQKGTLIVKEFVPIGQFTKNISGQIAILTRLDTGKKFYALRLTMPYYNSQYDQGDAVCIFDAKEIVSAINSLDYMITKNGETPSSTTYTEVIYQSNDGAQFGFYISGQKRKMFFQVSSKAAMFDDMSKLVELKSFFMTARDKIVELGGTM